MNRRALVIATASAAIGLFAGGAAILGPGRTDPGPGPEPDAGTLIRMHSPVIGPVGARVTIVEFFDPSCEACRAFYPVVKQIMSEAGGEVRLVLRYTPLHKGSDEAVRILEAARRQNRFQPVLEALLANQPEWAVHGDPDLEKAWQVAASAGLDVSKGMRDAAAPAVGAVLAQDMADVRANRVEQTPTFFVNGTPLREFSPQGLRSLVTSQLGQAGGA